MRAWEQIIITAPIVAGEGPILGEIPADVFHGDYVPEDRIVELPVSEVDGVSLVKGVVVGAMCHIFVKKIDEIRPHDFGFQNPQTLDKPPTQPERKYSVWH